MLGWEYRDLRFGTSSWMGEGFAPPFPPQSRIRICSRGAITLRSEEMITAGDMRMYLRG
jgi:hypothetical protein